MGGILEHNKVDFNNYISALRQENNYDYVGDETAKAVSDLFSCEVWIHSALPKPLTYKPNNGCILREPINLAFVEPAHYKALIKQTVSSSLLANNLSHDSLLCSPSVNLPSPVLISHV